MTDADALLDAIWATPDDDLPRLVYADWLQERGHDAYAEFIRLQCAVARVPGASPEATDYWKAIGSVWTRLARDWGWVVYSFPRLDAVDFRRGFLKPGVLALEIADLYPACMNWPDEFVIPHIELTDFEELRSGESAETTLRNHHIFRRCKTLRLNVPMAQSFLGSVKLDLLRELDVSPLEADEHLAILRNPTFRRLNRIRLRSVQRVPDEIRLRLRQQCGERLKWKVIPV